MTEREAVAKALEKFADWCDGLVAPTRVCKLRAIVVELREGGDGKPEEPEPIEVGQTICTECAHSRFYLSGYLCSSNAQIDCVTGREKYWVCELKNDGACAEFEARDKEPSCTC